MTVLSIAKIGRVFRLFRLFKLLRIIRFYRNVTNQDSLVTLMVIHPGFYLTIFTIVFVLITAFFLKMFEQSLNDELISFTNVLWFDVITITTLGYGDITPQSTVGKILSLFIICVGMGIIGTLSGNIASGLLSIGGMEDKIKKISIDNSNRYIAYKTVLDECYKIYNPIINSIPYIFLLKSEWGKRELSKKLPSDNRSSLMASYIKRKSTVQADINKKDDEIIYNFEFEMNSIMQLIKEPINKDTYIQKRIDRLDKGTQNYAQNIYQDILKDNNGNLGNNCALDMLLRSFNLNKHFNAKRYQEILEELTDIIFSPPTQNTLYIEKIYGVYLYYY